MMIFVKMFLYLFLLLFLTGCAADAPSPIVGTPRRRTLDAPQEAISETVTGPVPYSVLFTQAGASPSLHEPAGGAYIGAWLSQSPAHITLRSFGNLTGKAHALFVCEMEAGDEIPLSWLLHAITAHAAPIFYVHPKNDDGNPVMSLAELADLARGLGAYDVPMFLAFYPLAQGHGMTPEAYISLFRLARILFRTYAPQVAFVWVPPEGQGDATPAHPFYPGHDAVDWVGLPVQALRGHGGLSMDIPRALEPFHHAFQRYKPIMLLPAGVSHFSRIDYTYYINEAADEIQRVYGALAGFPRVKAVVYRDMNNIGARWDDMSITRENDLLLAYTDAVSGGYFLSALQPRPPLFRQWLRSVFTGYENDGSFYVDYETLTGELFLTRPGEAIEINGRAFVDTANLSLDITIDTKQRIIYINLPS
jgi:hypothetical protein